MNHLYNHTGISNKKENIFAALLNIALKDKMIRHDKMTSFQNLSSLAGVLLSRGKTKKHYFTWKQCSCITEYTG